MLSVFAKFYLICPNSLSATRAYIGSLSFSIVHRESHALTPLSAIYLVVVVAVVVVAVVVVVVISVYCVPSNVLFWPVIHVPRIFLL